MAILNILNIGSDATVGGDGHSPEAAFTIPAALRTGLIRACFPGNGLLDDFGPLAVPPVPIGSPTRVSAGYACDQANYLDMGVGDTASVTMAIIARRTSSAATGYAGNFNYVNSGTVLEGCGFHSSSGGTSMSFSGARTGLAGSPVSVASTLDQWGLYVGRAATALDLKLANLTNGNSFSVSTGVGTARAVSEAPIRGGAIVGSAFAGPCELALLLIWNRYLTDEDVVTLDTWATAYGADLGLSV